MTDPLPESSAAGSSVPSLSASDASSPLPRASPWRWAIALTIVLLALASATAVPVSSGTAAVITRFGDPIRVQVSPGLTWKAPPPIDRVESVDLRLRTTSSGVHSVLTQDGLIILVQAWIAWRIPDHGDDILRFVRATRNRHDDAANQLRTFLGSSLETITGRFPLDALLNTDRAKLRSGEYRDALRERLAAQARDLYGIEILAVGLERLMIPEATVAVTVQRMAAERDTVAEEKKAHGRKVAGEIRATTEKETRIIKATAEEEASRIEAKARGEAAAIYAAVHSQDPKLYRFLRSLDTLDQVVTNTTRLVVRTDAAPFDALVAAPLEATAPPVPLLPPSVAPSASP